MQSSDKPQILYPKLSINTKKNTKTMTKPFNSRFPNCVAFDLSMVKSAFKVLD